MAAQNENGVEDISRKVSPEEYSLVLPCSQQDFGQFISGLLGKAQTIEANFEGTFEITRDNIHNTFLLVDQRVHQQNESTLVQFLVKVGYDDGSSVLMKSLQDFLHYREVRPMVSVSAELTWTYLIKFPGKKIPEKQEIEMSIRNEGHYYLRRSASYPRGSGHIGIRISHTARTWGTDIESLLSGHIKTLLKTENKLKVLICRYSWLLGWGFGIVFFAIILLGVFYTANRVLDSQMSKAQPVLNFPGDAKGALLEKVNFIVEASVTGTWARFFFSLAGFLLVSLVLSFLLGICVSNMASNEPVSFLLLTEKAYKSRERVLLKRKRRWLLFILSMVAAIASGFIANIIFALISKHWTV